MRIFPGSHNLNMLYLVLFADTVNIDMLLEVHLFLSRCPTPDRLPQPTHILFETICIVIDELAHNSDVIMYPSIQHILRYSIQGSIMHILGNTIM